VRTLAVDAETGGEVMKLGHLWFFWKREETPLARPWRQKKTRGEGASRHAGIRKRSKEGTGEKKKIKGINWLDDRKGGAVPESELEKKKQSATTS